MFGTRASHRSCGQKELDMFITFIEQFVKKVTIPTCANAVIKCFLCLKWVKKETKKELIVVFCWLV